MFKLELAFLRALLITQSAILDQVLIPRALRHRGAGVKCTKNIEAKTRCTQITSLHCEAVYLIYEKQNTYEFV